MEWKRRIALLLVAPFCCGWFLSRAAGSFETTLVVRAGGDQKMHFTLKIVERL